MLRACARDAGPRASLLPLYSDMLATDGLSADADAFEGNGRCDALECIASTDVPSELFGRCPLVGESITCEREAAEPGLSAISDGAS